MVNTSIFMLMMFVVNPMHGGKDAFILDYDLSMTDCAERMKDYAIYDNINIEFVCEADLK